MDENTVNNEVKVVDNSHYKKPIIIGLAAILILTAIYFIVGVKMATPPNPDQNKTPENTIVNAQAGELPEGMPADIILAKDAKIISSYTGLTSDNQKQSTLVYSTSETPSSLNKKYFEYFAKSFWIFQSSNNGASTTEVQSLDKRELAVIQGNKTVSVNAFESPDKANQWFVAITLLTQSK